MSKKFFVMGVIVPTRRCITIPNGNVRKSQLFLDI